MIRLPVVLARPAVLLLFALYAAIGTAGAGRSDDHLLLFGGLVVVAALLLFSITVNDLADEAIDRVNLPGARSRPLVTGTGRRTDLRVMAGAAAVLAPVAAITLGWRCVLVTVAALAVSAAYSLRLSSRGAVGSLVLPACYVATPYLLGTYGAGATPDLLLLAGLYVGFLGRILLKDFRDLRGDALLGKRTGGGHRRDERLISAVAIVGRGLLVVLLVQLTPDRPALLVPALVAVFAAQALAMVRYGPPNHRLGQYSRQSMTTARSSVPSVGTSRTRNAAPPR